MTGCGPSFRKGNMNTEKIKPCPFCGSKKVEICRTNENACWVRCARCSSESDSRPKRIDAIKLWNKRPKVEGYAKIISDDEA